MHLNEIQMRDPFVLCDRNTATYYLYGTTDKDPWKARGVGFEAYTSSNLVEWEGPQTIFTPSPGFWATHNFWAPECHEYRGRYYLFASFKAEGKRRGTQILASDSPLGPFEAISEGPVTPRSWECLDGTLHIDGAGQPWMVFCHEWVQVNDGEVCALPLSADLKRAIGEPRLLFRASEAGWTAKLPRRDGSSLIDARVTDGPFLYRGDGGDLFMLWSSKGEGGYAMGYAKSESGSLEGPWVQRSQPLITADGGHGMIFKTLDGQLMLTYHAPNNTPHERPVFIPIVERDGELACR
ncbi:MAG: glycoside hydrolase family 43 protein [Sphaerochaeta sp.]|nr:glycoside hydrolase family 43 protein [Sphaerochaeta sp.]MDX9915076.1 glycoside hydrolase family 43 protein [Sphaerochaeta sp.]